MAEVETMEPSYRSPLRKLVRFFQKSRDNWKAKYHDCKRRLKKEQNQVRAVQRSRAVWREKAEAAALRVEQLERELAEAAKNAAAE
jgi:hypothetical protein